MRERVKNIVKIGGLLGIRQLWGLGCNLYLLAREPFLTLKNIRIRKDRSQTILISLVVLAPLFFYGVGRISWDLMRYNKLMIYSYGPVFWTTMLLEIVLIIYLAYWSWRVLKDGNS